MHSDAESPRESATTSPEQPQPQPAWLGELAALGRAVKQLFGAQMRLFAAELGLARSAVSWLLLAGLAATVAGVGMGLTLLALVALLLAHWFGSWLWALLLVLLLQGLFLGAAIMLFRRCMHWLSLPATRREVSAMMQDVAAGAAEADADAGPPRGDRA